MKQQQTTAVHRPRTVRERDGLTERAKTTLQEHPSLTLGELAADLHVSVRTLQRAFDGCGTDYTRERAEARWAKAVTMLGKEYSIELAARWSGYRSTPHFVKAFDTHFGITPGRFRQAASIENRLVQRRFVDRVKPVRIGSSEYYKRRRRYNADVRDLQGLVREMSLVAQEALLSVRRPERVVYGQGRPWPRRVSTPGRSRPGFDEAFAHDLDAMFWAQEYAEIVRHEQRLVAS